MFIVVGEWNNCLAVFPYLCRFGFFDYIHPKKFKDDFNVSMTSGHFGKADDRWWTNNPLIVDLFEPEKVIVVDKDKNQFALSSLSGVDRWRDEFSSGELWLMSGENFWKPV